jgi:hypothetical protein
MLGQLSSQIALSLISSKSARLGGSGTGSEGLAHGSQDGHDGSEVAVHHADTQLLVDSDMRSAAEVSTRLVGGSDEQGAASASASIELHVDRGGLGARVALPEYQRGHSSRRPGKRRRGKGQGQGQGGPSDTSIEFTG